MEQAWRAATAARAHQPGAVAAAAVRGLRVVRLSAPRLNIRIRADCSPVAARLPLRSRCSTVTPARRMTTGHFLAFAANPLNQKPNSADKLFALFKKPSIPAFELQIDVPASRCMCKAVLCLAPADRCRCSFPTPNGGPLCRS